MRTITFSEARSNLKQVLDTVVDDADFTVITRRDAADAVVMSLDSFNSWRETLYLLSSPANARHLARSLAELDAGKGRARALTEPPPHAVQEPKARYAARKAAAGVRKPVAKRGKPRG